MWTSIASINHIQPPVAELWPTMIAEVENHRAAPAPCRNKPQSAPLDASDASDASTRRSAWLANLKFNDTCVCVCLDSYPHARAWICECVHIYIYIYIKQHIIIYVIIYNLHVCVWYAYYILIYIDPYIITGMQDITRLHIVFAQLFLCWTYALGIPRATWDTVST